MAYDAYSLCPGGTGKKVKFCCPDLLGELDKLERMVSGQQYQAALEHVERLDRKFPNRACLMTAKAQMELMLGRPEEAEQTAQALVAQQPENPMALAYAAQAAFETSGSTAGLALLQRAIDASHERMHAAVLHTIAYAAEQLLAEGRIVAGRRHLALVLQYAPREEEMQRLLQQIDHSTVHPLLKLQWIVPAAPEGAAWKAEFDPIRLDIARGAWRRAAAQLESLIERYPDEAPLWQALAAARVGLADDLATAEALHRYARLASEEPDAIHAEALAQTLDEVDRGDWVDTVVATRGVADVEQVLARLAAHPRSLSMPVEPRDPDEDQPPPKAAYVLLTRPKLESGEDVHLEQAPRMLGRVFVFGRQTDREARLEIIARRGERLEALDRFLDEMLGEHAGPRTNERVMEREPVLTDALRREWLIPNDVPIDRQHALVREDRRRVLTQRLPQMAFTVFGGRTLAEAAADSQQRLTVQGWLLKAELTLTSPTAGEEVDELRQRLGLAIATPLEFTGLHVATRFGWLPRMDTERTGDDVLQFGVIEAMRTRLPAALQRLIPAAMARPALKELAVPALYAVLAEIQEDGARALAYLAQARAAAVAAGQSPAGLDLATVRLQLSRGEFETALKLLQRVAREHPREPGVQQQLAEILGALGYAPGTARAVEERGREAVAAAAPAEPGKIWTPESERGEAKSGLWLPGQD